MYENNILCSKIDIDMSVLCWRIRTVDTFIPNCMYIIVDKSFSDDISNRCF